MQTFPVQIPTQQEYHQVTICMLLATSSTDSQLKRQLPTQQLHNRHLLPYEMIR